MNTTRRSDGSTVVLIYCPVERIVGYRGPLGTRTESFYYCASKGRRLGRPALVGSISSSEQESPKEDNVS